jgi:hypothetical protein
MYAGLNIPRCGPVAESVLIIAYLGTYVGTILMLMVSSIPNTHPVLLILSLLISLGFF